MRAIYSTLLWLLFGVMLTSCVSNKDIVSKTFLKDDYLKKIATNPDFEVQIIYTQVDLKNKKFISSTFNLDPDKYFYPASTVKLPVAVLALQKINEINKEGIDLKRTDDMLTAAFRKNLTPAFIDTTTLSRKPNVERYIQKIFAVSDNDAYNRLYELLGPDYINRSMKSKGLFANSVINHRLSIADLTKEDNSYTNNIRFFRDKKVLYEKPEGFAEKEWKHHAKDAFKGIGYINNNDSLVNKAFDFSGKNFITLSDLEGTLQRILFPEFFSPDQRFNIKEDDYCFLKQCLSDPPQVFPFYKNKTEYHDSYVKFLMFGDSKESLPDDIKVYNKAGNAYGYMVDCAYIENKSKNIGFFLTAVIHVNKDKIYNDGKYEYDTVGFPFLGKLGRVVYAYELKKANKK